MPDPTECTKQFVTKECSYPYYLKLNIIAQRKTTGLYIINFVLLPCKWQTFTVHLYTYCTKWQKVILCWEKIVRLLVVIHNENIHEVASLRFLKLNLEHHNKISGRRTYQHIYIFSFMRLCSKSPSCNRIPQLFL